MPRDPDPDGILWAFLLGSCYSSQGDDSEHRDLVSMFAPYWSESKLGLIFEALRGNGGPEPLLEWLLKQGVECKEDQDVFDAIHTMFLMRGVLDKIAELQSMLSIRCKHFGGLIAAKDFIDDVQRCLDEARQHVVATSEQVRCGLEGKPDEPR